MVIMHARETYLVSAFEGLRATGVPLVGLEKNHFVPAGYSDDPGLYYFVPMIMKYLGLSLHDGVKLFLLGFIFLGWALGTYGMCRIFKGWLPRLIAAVGLFFLSYVAVYKASDVYVTMMFAVAAIVPNFLALGRKTKIRFRWLIPWLVFSGLSLGYCNFIRSHAGTGAAVFVVFWILLNAGMDWKKKALCLVVFTVGLSVANLHFGWMVKNRDQYLRRADKNYQGHSIQHLFWGNAYIGLGYLDNSYGIKYEDSVAFSKVLTVNPKAVWCSKEADDIIKKITFQFVEDHPLFFLKTLAAKALKLLLYFLKCSNLGFLCFFYVRPAWREMVPLAAGAVFYCLPGLLVMPYLAYVFGMVAMSTVFGIYMFGLAIEEFIQSKDGLIPGWMKA